MASSKFVAIKSPRKLIEVALPLDRINAAASKEKSIRFGHPSSLHLWWSRKPLAAARAVLFAQLVNDPGYERSLNRGVNKLEAAVERERLFKIIEDLVLWTNTKNEQVLSAARTEIMKSWRETCELNRNHPDAASLFDPEKLPAFHDPFAGGGTIPLEAQRLGLESFASDLNPVAVTINKAMIEVPGRFANRSPIGPSTAQGRGLPSRADWPGASGLAEDVRRFGAWIRQEAEARIGSLYPKVIVTPEMALERRDLEPFVGQAFTAIAWLWTRTVKSPNPAYSHVDIPLLSTFVLSSQPGKEAYVEPLVEGDTYTLKVRLGVPAKTTHEGTTAGKRHAFVCLLSGVPVDYDYIRAEGQAGRMGSKLVGVVIETKRGRVYLSPTGQQIEAALRAEPIWIPELALPNNPRDFKTPKYGLETFGALFLPRQLVLLNTLSTLVGEAIARCLSDGVQAGIPDDNRSLESGGSGPLAYAQAVGIYLSLAVGKVADYGSGNTSWSTSRGQARNTFVRQAIPMMWGSAEVNPFALAAGDFSVSLDGIVRSIDIVGDGKGVAVQQDAQTQTISQDKVISTDPPYFDNIGYAELSDFFYIWLRRSLRPVFPAMFSTLAAPKEQELFALPHRHTDKAESEAAFIEGMRSAVQRIRDAAHPAYPITIYYAFKQGESEGVDLVSSGWHTFLTAVIGTGLSIVGTWPMRTERESRSSSIGTNAVASSIVLVCRQRDTEAAVISRSQFLRELRLTLPDALIEMTQGGENSPVAPVDLSQAIIGPGMGIFSKYRAVLEADGSPMSAHTALQLINRFLADDDFDSETQFCLQWFETFYFKPGSYGSADVAARAKGTDLSSLHRDGIVESGSGEVRLLRWSELSEEWTPNDGNDTPAWQALHQLIRTLNTVGEQPAGALLARMPALSGLVRTLAYRLYTLCERKGLAEDARPYNELIGAWAGIELAAVEAGPVETQANLF